MDWAALFRGECFGCAVITGTSRLRQSRDFYAILDTDPEEQFDRLAKLASLTLRMLIAGVSLLDTNRQWFKAMVGTP